jgi:hypothetical protein
MSAYRRVTSSAAAPPGSYSAAGAPVDQAMLECHALADHDRRYDAPCSDNRDPRLVDHLRADRDVPER